MYTLPPVARSATGLSRVNAGGICAGTGASALTRPIYLREGYATPTTITNAALTTVPTGNEVDVGDTAGVPLLLRRWNVAPPPSSLPEEPLAMRRRKVVIADGTAVTSAPAWARQGA